MNNAGFGKTMNDLRNHRDSKLVTTKGRIIIWCQNQTIIQQFFFRKIITNRNEKTQIILNKQVSFGLTILEIS